MSAIIMKNGALVDSATDLSRAEFYTQNEHRAKVSKRTFYNRVLSDDFNSFEEALVTEANAKPVQDVTEEESFGVSRVNEEELSFGKYNIRAPMGS